MENCQAVKKPKKCRINRLLIPVKFSYFFELSAVASLLMYMPIYMKNLGMNSEETGVISGIMPFVGACLKPSIGSLADKLKKTRLLLAFCCIITGICHFLLYFVPQNGISKAISNFSNYQNDSYLIGVNLTLNGNNTSSQFSYGRTFWIFFLIYFLAQCFFTPIFSLLDAIVYEHLGQEHRVKWGQQRLWGTVGFGAMAVVSSAVMDVIRDKKLSFLAAFVMFLAFQSLTGLAVFFYKSKNSKNSTNLSPLKKQLKGLLKLPQFVGMVVVVFVYGALNGVIETFVFWHLITLGKH